MRTNLTTLIAIATLSAACGGGSPPPVDTPPGDGPEPVATTEGGEAAPDAPKAEVKPLLERQKAYVAAEQTNFNAHDAKAYAAMFAEDAVSVGPGPKGMEEMKGRAPVVKMFSEIFAAFPDMKSKTRRVLANKDVAVMQWVASGTHTGDFMGMKGTKKPVGFQGVTVVWLDDAGKVKRAETYMDGATIAGQIGMSKNPARKVATLPTGETEWVMATGDAAETKNAELMKTFYATMTTKDEKKFLALLAPTVVHVDYTMPGEQKGHEGAKKEMAMMKKAFPDMKAELEKAWAFGPSFVVNTVTFSGTHTGPMGPIKATNKKVTGHSLDVLEIKDGKLVRGESYGSSLEWMAQMGLLDKPGKPDKPAKGNKPAKGGSATPAKTPAKK